MKKIMSFIIISALFSISLVHNVQNVSAEGLFLNYKDQEVYIIEEEGAGGITPYASISALITYLTYLCIMHCDKITAYVNNLAQTGGAGTIAMGRPLWNDFSNWMTSKFSKTPKSINSGWNAPDNCIWSGPPVGGVWLCPQSL